MKYLFIKTFLVLVTIFIFSTLQAQDTIRIGIDHDYPPYEFLDENGQPTGFNVELLKSILTDYGKPYKIIAEPWFDTYEKFKNGKTDIISILFSAERNKLFNLSIPQNLVSYCAFYNKKNPNEINSIDYNSEVVVVKDDILHDVIKPQMNENNITIAVSCR